MIQNLLSKKLIVTLLAMISCSLLVLNKNISDGVYSTIMVAAIGGYLTANVVQKNNESK